MATIERAALYAAPGQSESPVELKKRYDNFIGGFWVAPIGGKYTENVTPGDRRGVHRGAALDTGGHRARARRRPRCEGRVGRDVGRPSARKVLNRIADAIEENLEMLAVAESWENGKPVRETLAADIPLAADHFRYFASVIRAEEGVISELDKSTVAYHFREPLGVVGQIIPFNFPILMAAWKLAPALAAGNCVVLKPASPTPWSILKFAELIEEIVPPGVINIVNGPGAEIGKALATNKRIAKIAFTGETVTGRLIMQYAAQNIIPSTTELGGKSPNIFFADVMAEDDDFLDKAIEGLVLYAFNKGEVCTCPSRALIEESIYDQFMERCLERIAAIRQGHPLDPDDADRRAGLCDAAREDRELRQDRPRGGRRAADRRQAQHARRRAGGRLLLRADRLQGPQQDEDLPGGDLRPRARGDDVQERGRGARDRKRHDVRPRRRRLDARHEQGVPHGPRHQGRARVWTNCYHLYPAHAAFGGYKVSGVGRENHKMMLDHYTQTKCLLVSYDPKPLGFF